MPDLILSSIASKTCSKCGELKPATAEFFLKRNASLGTLKNECKICATVFRKEYYAANKEALLANNKEYVAVNRDAVQAQRKSYYEANSAYVIDRNQAYRAANRELSRERAANYTRKKSASDPVYAMRLRVCALIGTRLRSGGYSKKSKSHEILGCDWGFFKKHIELQFVSGMTWENRGTWHLDHLVPMATAKTESDVLALSHFTNLRPMWAADNIRKSNKITHLI